MKECMRCHKKYARNTQNFLPDKRRKDGMTNWCRECSREYDRQYRAKHSTLLKENHRKYDNSPKRAYLRLKQSVKRFTVTITQEEFVKWYNSQQKKCCYCGIEEIKLPLDLDSFNRRTPRLTIDRKDSKKGYELGNLALCCLRCNSIKADFFTPLEMEEIGHFYVAKRWEDANKH